MASTPCARRKASSARSACSCCRAKTYSPATTCWCTWDTRSRRSARTTRAPPGTSSTRSSSMHERAVCQALIEQVERVARDHDARRVISVVVAIGPLSGVEPRLLEHAYPLAAAGTVAESASLVVETEPVRVRCRTCGAETDALPNRLVCAACGDWQVDVTSGEQMLLKRVEIETAEAPV